MQKRAKDQTFKNRKCQCGSSNFRKFSDVGGTICLDCSSVDSVKTVKTTKQVQIGNKIAETTNVTTTIEALGNEKKAVTNELQIVARTSTEQRLATAFIEIARISKELEVDKPVLLKALSNYKAAVEMWLIKGRTIKSLCAAAFYIACRQCNCPRSVSEITAVSQTGKRELNKACKILKKALKFSFKPLDPLDYLQHVSKKFKFDDNTLKAASEILEIAKQIKCLSSKDPAGTTAAAIYMGSIISGEKLSQRKLSIIFNLTEATIRNRCNDMRQIREE